MEPNAVNGINSFYGGFNPIANGYQNAISAYDMYDNDSVFGGGYMNPGMGGLMNPAMAGMGYMDPTWYINQQLRGSQAMATGQAQLQKVSRDAQMLAYGKENSAMSDLAVLNMRAKSGDQTSIQLLVKKCIESLRELYPNATNKELGAEAIRRYKAQFGTDFVIDLKAHSSGSFMQGVKQAVGLGLIADNITAEENIAALKDIPVDRLEDRHKTGGRMAGGALFAGIATVVLAVGAAIVTKSLKPLKGIKWALLLAPIGAGAGFLSTIGENK
jgi:hypothetical protein